jgi:hypothetical protein
MKLSGAIFIVFVLSFSVISLTYSADEGTDKKIKMTPNHSLQLEIAHLTCRQTSDCVLVPQVCAQGWVTLNKKYQNEAQLLVDQKDRAASCPSVFYVQPPVACLDGLCTVMPDKDKCMKRQVSGECVSTCTILAPNGKCQHTCQKGLACD